jgi:hypothetical protein
LHIFYRGIIHSVIVFHPTEPLYREDFDLKI